MRCNELFSEVRARKFHRTGSLAGVPLPLGITLYYAPCFRHDFFIWNGPASGNIFFSFKIGPHAVLHILESVEPDVRPEVLRSDIRKARKPFQASAIGGGEGR